MSVLMPDQSRPAGLLPAGFDPQPVDRFELRDAATGEVLAIAFAPNTEAVIDGDDGSDREVVVRAINACGLVDRGESIQARRRVAFDDGGVLQLPAPGPVRDLVLQPLAGGMVLASWRSETRRATGVPQAASFDVFMAVDGGSIDYAAPAASTPAAGFRPSMTLGPFGDGQAVTVGVRAVSGAGVAEAGTLTETAIADAQPPAPITMAALEVTPE